MESNAEVIVQVAVSEWMTYSDEPDNHACPRLSQQQAPEDPLSPIFPGDDCT